MAILIVFGQTKNILYVMYGSGPQNTSFRAHSISGLVFSAPPCFHMTSFPPPSWGGGCVPSSSMPSTPKAQTVLNVPEGKKVAEVFDSCPPAISLL